MALVRLAALGLAWWLTASTVLYLLASASKVPGLVWGVRWVTVAPVRRMIDGALATTILLGSTLAAPSAAAAASADRAAVVQLDKRPEEADESPQRAYQPRPAGDKVKPGYTPAPPGDLPSAASTLGAEPPSSSTQPAPQSDNPLAVSFPGTYVVRPSDNLWTIAEKQLATATGRHVDELAPGEVRSYWLRVIDANEDRIRSTNPDLILPKEKLDLPKATGSAATSRSLC